MLTNFKYTLLSTVRDPGILFWPLAFPVIMALMFNFMFSNLGESYQLEPVALAVVADEAYEDALGLDETLRSVDATGDQHIVDLAEYATEDAAREAVLAGDAQAYLTVQDRVPQLHVPTSDLNERDRLHLTAVSAVLDGYVRVWHEMAMVAEEDPAYLLGPAAMARLSRMAADGFDPQGADFSELAKLAMDDEADAVATMDAFLSDAVSTRALTLTRADPDPSARYFYALLGMAAGLGSAIAFQAVHDLSGKGSALGARRTVSGTPRTRLLASALAASWLLAFGCLLVGYAFMRYAVHVDFGDRGWACVLGLCVSSFAFCALGALLGSFASLKAVMMMAVTLPLSFFAGLYGTASQRVADGIAATYPCLAALNPVRSTAQLFYSLLYYDTLDRYCGYVLLLASMGMAMVAVAALRMRRQSYATL